VRVRARRLHDGRGVGEGTQQEGKSRHRSSNGADHAAPTSPSRGRRPKTCPVLRRSVGRLVRRRADETPKDLCGGRGRSGPDRGLPRGRLSPAAGTPLLEAPFGSGGRRESNPPAGSRPPTDFEGMSGSALPSDL